MTAIIGGSTGATRRPCADCGGPRFHLRDLSDGRSVCGHCATAYPHAFDHPDDHAIRASLLHAVANTSDEHARSIDPPCTPQTTPEHVTGLAVSLGDVARCEDDIDLMDALVEHAALALGWLELLVREEQAA